MRRTKIKLLIIWRKLLLIIFAYSFYHLIRDILQDIFNLHNSFTEFLHYEPNPDKLPLYLAWTNFGGYRKWITFPIESFLLLTIPKVRKKNIFTKIDGLILVVILFTVILWLFLFCYS